MHGVEGILREKDYSLAFKNNLFKLEVRRM
jgi:hypothetical protein